jgi:hypothetical protein
MVRGHASEGFFINQIKHTTRYWVVCRTVNIFLVRNNVAVTDRGYNREYIHEYYVGKRLSNV